MDTPKKRSLNGFGELNDPNNVDYLQVPEEWNNEDGIEFLEEAHEALLKLQQHTHKRHQTHKRTKPIEGWR